MAIVNPFMVKSILGTEAETELVLEADSGSSLMVRDILTCPEADRYLTVKTAKSLVGHFRIDTVDLGSHLSDIIAPGIATKEPTVPPYRPSILHQMAEQGIFKGYPIAEGQKMVLAHDDDGAMGNTVIVYEEYEAGDITSEMPNGTEADEYTYVNYGRFGTAPALIGTYHYDTQFSPTEFPAFPFDKVVPAHKTIDVHALLASDRNIIAGANGLATTFYALKSERENLFDEDLRGILAVAPVAGLANNVLSEEGASILGEGSHLYRRPVLWFDPAIHFDSGEELNIFASMVLGGGAEAAIDLVQSEIGVVQTVRTVS